MSSEEPIRPDNFPADLKPLEAALGSLVPTASRIDRDRLMYLAGAANDQLQRSRRGRIFRAFWPVAMAALLLVSLGLGAVLAFRDPGERVVHLKPPLTPASQPSPSIASSESAARENPSSWTTDRASVDVSYLVLREQVLRFGVTAFDTPTRDDQRSDHRDVRNRALLNELLGG